MTARAGLLAVLVAACGVAGPEPLSWNEATCTHCHMTLADDRFGAEIITVKGRVFPFDDVGCAAEHLVAGEPRADEVSSVWVIDYTHPDSLIAAAGATYVRGDAFLTPMGSGVIAVADRERAEQLAAERRGTVLTWEAVLELARQGRLAPR